MSQSKNLNLQKVENVNPDEDGITHIRLSVQGKTELGQYLAVGAERKINDPVYGKFNSIFAAICYLDSKCKIESLREESGKNIVHTSYAGLPLDKSTLNNVCDIVDRSIQNDPKARKLLMDNDLPLMIYDVINKISTSTYGKVGDKNESTDLEPVDKSVVSTVYVNKSLDWYIHRLAMIRNVLKSQAETP